MPTSVAHRCGAVSGVGAGPRVVAVVVAATPGDEDERQARQEGGRLAHRRSVGPRARPEQHLGDPADDEADHERSEQQHTPTVGAGGGEGHHPPRVKRSGRVPADDRPAPDDGAPDEEDDVMLGAKMIGNVIAGPTD